MALLPSVTQIPAQRVPFNERPQPPEYVAREWYRFFDNSISSLLHSNVDILLKKIKKRFGELKNSPYLCLVIN